MTVRDLIRKGVPIGRSRLASLSRFLRGRGIARAEVRSRDPVTEAIEKAHQEWVAVRGDKTLRLEYDLSPKSVVLDVGGFEGQWASDIFGMYLCDVHVFEPVREHFESISRRFQLNKSIHVYPFGLGASARRESIAVAGDASSIVRAPSNENESIDIVEAGDFLNEHFPATLDLVKINIEGAEYELLEHLISQGVTKRVRNIQVQFHNFIPHAFERMRAIQQDLAVTHKLTYQYPFVWENWRRKNDG